MVRAFIYPVCPAIRPTLFVIVEVAGGGVDLFVRRYNAGMDDRLTTVEEKIAHLEKFVSELDGVVREMYDMVGEVKRDVGRLRAQMEQPTQEDDGGDDLEAQKPPHY